MKRIHIKIFLLLLILTPSIFGQTKADSSSAVKNEEQTFTMTKSPWGAVARSAVIPGWGQYYNESYWKIPIVWGGLGVLIYGYSFYQKRYLEYHDKYLEAVANGDSFANNYLRSREFYKDNRDQMAVYVGLAYFLNLLDAFVDAHLFDFDVSENIYTRSPQLNIRIGL